MRAVQIIQYLLTRKRPEVSGEMMLLRIQQQNSVPRVKFCMICNILIINSFCNIILESFVFIVRFSSFSFTLIQYITLSKDNTLRRSQLYN